MNFTPSRGKDPTNQNPILIDAYQYQLLFNCFNPNHPEFGKDISDNYFVQSLQSNKFNKVIFTFGSYGSGKTELITNRIIESEFNVLVVDSDFTSRLIDSKIIKLALEAGKEVEIKGVLSDMVDAYTNTLQNESKSGNHILGAAFLQNHKDGHEAIPGLIEEFIFNKKVSFSIIDNTNQRPTNEFLKLDENEAYQLYRNNELNQNILNTQFLSLYEQRYIHEKARSKPIQSITSSSTLSSDTKRIGFLQGNPQSLNNVQLQSEQISSRGITRINFGQDRVSSNLERQKNDNQNELNPQRPNPTLLQVRPIIIDPDALKHHFQDFAEASHEKYSQMAKEQFKQALKLGGINKVIFTGGGTGSGKSFVLLPKLEREGFNGIIYDGTLANLKNSIQKINQALDAGKEVEIRCLVVDIKKAWEFTLDRETKTSRGVPLKVFHQIHSDYIKNIPKLINYYKDNPNIKFIVYNKQTADYEDKIRNPEVIQRLFQKIQNNSTNLITELNTYEQQHRINASRITSEPNNRPKPGGIGRNDIRERINDTQWNEAQLLPGGSNIRGANEESNLSLRSRKRKDLPNLELNSESLPKRPIVIDSDFFKHHYEDFAESSSEKKAIYSTNNNSYETIHRQYTTSEPTSFASEQFNPSRDRKQALREGAFGTLLHRNGSLSQRFQFGRNNEKNDIQRGKWERSLHPLAQSDFKIVFNHTFTAQKSITSKDFLANMAELGVGQYDPIDISQTFEINEYKFVSEIEYCKVSQEDIFGRTNISPMLTTPDILKCNDDILKSMNVHKGMPFSINRTMSALIDKDQSLPLIKRKTLVDILNANESIQIIEGRPGGFANQAIKTIWNGVRANKPRDFELVVVSPNQRAANVLTKLGIEGVWLMPDYLEYIKNKPNKFSFDPSPFVIIEKADQYQPEILLELANNMTKNQQRLVLVGDIKMNDKIEPGHSLQFIASNEGKHIKTHSVYKKQLELSKLAHKAAAHASTLEPTRTIDDLLGLGMCNIIKDKQQSLEFVASKYLQNLGKSYYGKEQELLPQIQTVINTTNNEEGILVHEAIRKDLKLKGYIDSQDYQLNTLTKANLDPTQKENIANYEPNQILRFTGNIQSFKIGEKYKVDSDMTIINIRTQESKPLPTDLPDYFEVYNQSKISISKGDLIQIEARAKVQKDNGKSSYTANGGYYKIEDIDAKTGNIKLSNEWNIPNDFGLIKSAYYSTPDSTLGKIPNHAILFTSEDSLSGINHQSFQQLTKNFVQTNTIVTSDTIKLSNAIEDPSFKANRKTIREIEFAKIRNKLELKKLNTPARRLKR